MALVLNRFLTGNTSDESEVDGFSGVSTVGNGTGIGYYSLNLSDYIEIEEARWVASGGTGKVLGFAYWGTAIPSSDKVLVQAVDSTGGAAGFALIHRASTGRLDLLNGNGATVLTVSGPFDASTWAYVRLYWVNDGVNGEAVLTINRDYEGTGQPVQYGPVTSQDFENGTFWGYRFNGASSLAHRIAGIYCYSGATSYQDGPAAADVIGYYSTLASATPDSGDALDVGTWDDVQDAAFSTATTGEYTTSSAQSGYVLTNDAGGSANTGGPNSDAWITGSIVGVKGLWVMQRDGGGGTDHFGLFGNSVDGTTQSADLDPTTSFAPYEAYSEAASVVPTPSEYGAIGFQKSSGGQNFECGDMLLQVLHKRPAKLHAETASFNLVGLAANLKKGYKLLAETAQSGQTDYYDLTTYLDNDNVWVDEANAVDGDPDTFAYSVTGGSPGFGELDLYPNAPASGPGPISLLYLWLKMGGGGGTTGARFLSQSFEVFKEEFRTGEGWVKFVPGPTFLEQDWNWSTDVDNSRVKVWKETGIGTQAQVFDGYLEVVTGHGYQVRGYSATLTYNATGIADLEADPGSFALTGSTAELLRSLRLPCSTGSYSLTGSSADLLRGFRIQAEAGSFNLAGAAAGLTVARNLQADAGAIVLAGSDADLLRSLRIPSEAGAYALTGSDADLAKTRLLDAESGAFLLTGSDAELTRAAQLPATAGAFALTGSDADLDRGLRLTCSAGSFLLTGSDADLEPSIPDLQAEPGAYLWTGSDADLLRSLRIAAAAGAYALTGSDANLAKTRILGAESGSFALSGQPAELLRALRLPCSAGAYNVAGSDADLERGLRLAASAGSYDLAGQTADFELGFRIQLEAGSFALTGSDAELTRAAQLQAEAGSFALTGSDAELTKTVIFQADAGAYNVTGSDADLVRALQLEAEAASYLVSGSDATLGREYRLQADAGAYNVTGSDAELLRSLRIASEAGTYTLAGAQARLQAQRLLEAVQGSILLTGSAADLDRGYHLGAEAGAYALAGEPATLGWNRRLTLAPGAYLLTGSDAILQVGGLEPKESSDRETLLVADAPLAVRVLDQAERINVDDRVDQIEV